jgi:RNA polymerase sigma-70 factor, ECF subfamily
MNFNEQKNELPLPPVFLQEDCFNSPHGDCTMSDAELITKVVDRSAGALAALLVRHGPLLRSVIGRVVNDGAEVEEALQDVFLHVWNHADAYSEKKGEFLGWLVTMARRRAVDRVRSRAAYQRATTRFQESTFHHAQSHRSSWIVDKEVQQRELQVMVEDHLRLLPALQSQVLKLAFFSGFSQREIAVHLSLPLGTVKTRIELGVSKLRRSGLLKDAA